MRRRPTRESVLRRLEEEGPLPRQAFTEGERRVLRELVRQGEVLLRRGRYLRKKEPLLEGRLSVTRHGRAFLVQEGQDVELLPESLLGGLHGDTVLARKSGQKAVVVRVLERAHERVVGTVEEVAGSLMLRPLEARLPRFLVNGPANPGDMVVLVVEDFGDGVRPPMGRVVEVIGRAEDPGVDVLAIVYKYGLRPLFPLEVLAEAAALPDDLDPKDLAGRLDLRGEEVFTIDGEDAKDLDDAISLSLRPHGYRLGVHIADVAHYVREGSLLDQEAFRRSTSVYLVDRVLPMFPPRLSNGLASLHPDVDRLTLSVFLELDEAGRRRSFEVVPSVIRSKGRLTYEGVHELLTGQDTAGAATAARFRRTLQAMAELMQKLRALRLARGAITFDIPEDKVLLAPDGRPLAIRRRQVTVADQIIEEFMIAANEAVAEFATLRRLPVLFRVHEPPPEDKVKAFRDLMRLLGIRFARQKVPPPKAFQEVLERVSGTKDERLVATLALRTMARARYAPENLGHYGLAAPYYAHFTSPIRRYPDLILHRVLKEYLQETLHEERRQHLAGQLEHMALHTSAQERLAEEAERESVLLKKVAFMADKVGEVYPGVITGVTHFGLFVETSLGVEGLVPLASMHDDFYRLDEPMVSLRGARTARTFRLGQEVRVRVRAAHVEDRTVDLELMPEEEGQRRRREGAARPATRRTKETFDRGREKEYNKKKRHRSRRSSGGVRRSE